MTNELRASHITGMHIVCVMRPKSSVVAHQSHRGPNMQEQEIPRPTTIDPIDVSLFKTVDACSEQSPAFETDVHVR